jgi:hypothetical protein
VKSTTARQIGYDGHQLVQLHGLAEVGLIAGLETTLAVFRASKSWDSSRHPSNFIAPHRNGIDHKP